MRAAIYARYSSDLQSRASIPDQIRLCQRLCAEQGWTVIDMFVDEAMSGASHLRPGFQALQQKAMNGHFDIVVAEALDRLSRDQEHIAALYKRMTFLNVKIITKAEGEINELHIGLGGTMSALFLRQLSQKTHRGLEGRVRAGRSAGGISFGYQVKPGYSPDNAGDRGERTIDPDEAAVIQRIFREYAAGKSARTIAIELNRENIRPPRASDTRTSDTWGFSTISGNWKRGTGILNNELYVGRLVWNRQRFIKDPATGKRQARPNPPEDWIVQEVPELRIIDDETWHRGKVKQGAIRDNILTARTQETRAPKIEGARRSRYLLSGLLTCGCCGGGYSMISDSRYGCSAARNKGTCNNRKTITRQEIEERVLSGLRRKLMAPELVAEFIAEFHREVQKERHEALAARAGLESQHNRIRKEIANIVSAISQGMFHPSMKEKMDALEAERAKLEVKLSATPELETVVLHPGIFDVYRRKVEVLSESLNDQQDRSEAVELLRGLIERIVIRPGEAGHEVELHGALAGILSMCEAGFGRSAKAREAAGIDQLTMVAGTGVDHNLRSTPVKMVAGGRTHHNLLFRAAA